MLLQLFLLLFAYVHVLHEGNPTKALQEVVSAAQEIRPADVDLNSAEKINAYLQSCWLRKSGTERNRLAFEESEKSKALNLFPFLQKLQMVDAYHPSHEGIKVIAVFGGAYPCMSLRIYEADKFYQTLNHKPKAIVLTGERTLEKTRPDDVSPLDEGAPENCHTEKETAGYLIAPFPEFSIIHAEKEKGKIRATTADNIKAFSKYLKDNGIEEGVIVFVCAQPSTNYQMAQAQTLKIEFPKLILKALAVKDPMDPEELILISMDALARQLYTEIKALNQR